jgi:hypothetical protein
MKINGGAEQVPIYNRVEGGQRAVLVAGWIQRVPVSFDKFKVIGVCQSISIWE